MWIHIESRGFTSFERDTQVFFSISVLLLEARVKLGSPEDDEVSWFFTLAPLSSPVLRGHWGQWGVKDQRTSCLLETRVSRLFSATYFNDPWIYLGKSHARGKDTKKRLDEDIWLITKAGFIQGHTPSQWQCQFCNWITCHQPRLVLGVYHRHDLHSHGPQPNC